MSRILRRKPERSASANKNAWNGPGDKAADNPRLKAFKLRASTYVLTIDKSLTYR